MNTGRAGLAGAAQLAGAHRVAAQADRLNDAATPSMEYAADFDPAEYEGLVRPWMSPPFLSPGFWGEQNEDHSTMLRLMARTQSTMKKLLRSSRRGDIPPDVRAAATAWSEAQSRNRQHHVLVCDKVVPGGGSLLKDHFARTESQLISHGRRSRVVTVIERWLLRPEVAERGLEIMTEMDDLVGPSAHADPGWSGHAHFCRSLSTPNEFLVIYPWSSVGDHEQFRVTEDALLTGFNERYCANERRISYYDELPVDVDHDHG